MPKPFWEDPKALNALYNETSSPEAIRREAEVHPAFQPFLTVPEREYRDAVQEAIEGAPGAVWMVARRLAGRIRGVGVVSMVELLLRLGIVISEEIEQEQA
jgi:hypothetical protein